MWMREVRSEAGAPHSWVLSAPSCLSPAASFQLPNHFEKTVVTSSGWNGRDEIDAEESCTEHDFHRCGLPEPADGCTCLALEALVAFLRPFSEHANCVLFAFCAQAFICIWVILLVCAARFSRAYHFESKNGLFSRWSARCLNPIPLARDSVTAALLHFVSLTFACLPLEYVSEELADPSFGLQALQGLCKIHLACICYFGFLFLLRFRIGFVGKLRRVTPCGRRPRSSKTKKRGKFRLIALILLCNLVCAEGIHVLENCGHSPGQHDLPFSSRPCGESEAAGGYDCHEEGLHAWRDFPSQACAPLRCRANWLLPGSDRSFVPVLGFEYHISRPPILVDAMYGDEAQLMQAGPPFVDAITQHIFRVTGRRSGVRVYVWFHPSHSLGVFVQWCRILEYDAPVPAGPLVRGIWADQLGRDTGFLYPVRPPPLEDGGPASHVLVSCLEGDTIMPALVEISTTDQSFRGSFFFVVRRFLTGSEIFDQVIPQVECIWLHECSILMGAPGQVRIFHWDDLVPLYEGAFLRIRYIWRPQEQGESSTCDEGSSSDDSDSDSTSLSGPPSGNETLPANRPDAASGEERLTRGSGGSHPLALDLQAALPLDLTDDDKTSLMHMPLRRFVYDRPLHGAVDIPQQVLQDSLLQYLQAEAHLRPTDPMMTMVWILVNEDPVNLPITMFRAHDRRMLTTQVSEAWRGHNGYEVASAFLCSPQPPRFHMREVPGRSLLVTPKLELHPHWAAWLMDVYLVSDSDKVFKERVAIWTMQLTVGDLAQRLGYDAKGARAIRLDFPGVTLTETEEICFPPGTFFRMLLRSASSCRIGPGVDMPDEASLFQVRHRGGSVRPVLRLFANTVVSSQVLLRQEVVQLRTARGPWPVIWIHLDGQNEPCECRLSFARTYELATLVRAVRWALRSFVGLHVRLYLGYVDPQPLPSQSLRDDVVHLIASKHRPRSVMPIVLHVWQYHEHVLRTQWIVTALPQLATWAHSVLAIQRWTVCHLSGVRCTFFLEGVHELGPVPLRVHPWQRIDGEFSLSPSTECAPAETLTMSSPDFSTPAVWEDNTATSDGETGLTPGHEHYDDLSFMQRTVSMKLTDSFARAAERQGPFLNYLWLTRRELTDAWLDAGRDIGYDFFRVPEQGVWEKQVLGWRFLAYEQRFGESFTIQLYRHGLWAAQLISPFEDDGILRICFLTVFPMPQMLDLGGGPRSQSDSVVLALVEEVFASDYLPLVVQHFFDGERTIVAVQCDPGCTPNFLCHILGFSLQCDPPFEAHVYFRFDDLERTFVGHQRLGLPKGAFVQLFSKHMRPGEDCDLWGPPFREHEVLQISSNLPASDPLPDLGDEASLVQTPWIADMNYDESDFLEAAERLVRDGRAGDGAYPAMLLVRAGDVFSFDVLRHYLGERFPIADKPVFTIHVWAVAHQIVTFARVTALQQRRSFTRSLVEDWADWEERLPWWLHIVEPQPGSISLRLMPIDLVMLSQAQKEAGCKVFIIDILYVGMPKRVAFLYQADETVAHVLQKLELYEICTRGRHSCIFSDRAPEARRWMFSERLRVPHGTCFVLEFMTVCEATGNDLGFGSSQGSPGSHLAPPSGTDHLPSLPESSGMVRGFGSASFPDQSDAEGHQASADDTFAMMQLGRRVVPPPPEPHSGWICSTGMSGDCVKEAFLSYFCRPLSTSLQIRTYIHVLHGTPVRNAITLRFRPSEQFTHRILEAWRIPSDRDLYAVFVYPTPHGGIRGSAIPILLAQLEDVRDFFPIYVELHLPPYQRGSVQVTPWTTVGEMLIFFLQGSGVTDLDVRARNMDKPQLLLDRGDPLHAKPGDYVVLLPHRPRPQCIMEVASPSSPLASSAATGPVSFLQLSFHFQPCVTEELARSLWARDVMEGLRPPGNVVEWKARDLQTMDDLAFVDGKEVVVDYDMVPQADEPRKIHLSDYLDFPQDLPDSGLALDHTSGLVVDLPDLRGFADSLFIDLPSQHMPWNDLRQHLPEECQGDFDCLLMECGKQYDKLELYCDGSYMPQKSSKAAWAFVVLGSCQGKRYLVDGRHGQVECDPMGTGWIACDDHSAKAGEVTALVRAIEWCFRRSSTAPHSFLYDAQIVGGAASGQYSFDPMDTAMVVLRSMSLALQTYLPGQVDWTHVKAHAGCLGNEIADVCAKQAIWQDVLDDTPIDYTSIVVGPRKAVELLWWFFSGFGPPGVLPECRDGKLLVPPMKISGPQLPKKFLKTQKAVPQRTKKIRLAAVTYNVSSLQQRKGSFFVSYLRAQADACEYDVVFLQETRTKESQLVQSQTHYRLTSAAAEGRGGVELWLLRTRASDGKAVFAKQDIRVIYATAEIMVVKAKYRGLPIVLFTAHAPHSGSSHGAIDAFWKELTCALHPVLSNCRHFLGGIDANAHFGADSLPHVGPHGLEGKTNLGGDLFKTFLQHFAAMLPTTFEGIHSGETATWVSNVSGAKARCDYFVTPCEWSDALLETAPHPGFDAGTAGFDHTPLSIGVVFLAQVASNFHKLTSFDRQQLSKTAPGHLQEIFARPPVISWDTHVDEHAVQLADWVEQTLHQNFPLQGCRPRKSYITDETWEIRNQRMECRRENQAQRQHGMKLTMLAAYGAWKWGVVLPTQQLFLSVISAVKLLRQLQKRTLGLTRRLAKALRADRTMTCHHLVVF